MSTIERVERTPASSFRVLHQMQLHCAEMRLTSLAATVLIRDRGMLYTTCTLEVLELNRWVGQAT